jgi:signal peptidase I
MDADDRRRWIAVAVIAGGVLAIIAIRYVIGHSGIWWRIPTGAMVPTIPVGSYVLANPLAYRHASPKRGDIVTFRYPLDPRVSYVKRVIALPGETVEIRDKVVFINGTKLDEPYAFHDDDMMFPKSVILPEPYKSRDNFGPFVVSPDSYFMMGDNRDRSSDSRYWGTCPRKLIRGRVVRVFR